jgi:hypothetical protein
MIPFKNTEKCSYMKLRKPSDIHWDTEDILNEERLFNPDDLEQKLEQIETKFKKFKGMIFYEIQKSLRNRNKIKRSLKRSK